MSSVLEALKKVEKKSVGETLDKGEAVSWDMEEIVCRKIREHWRQPFVYLFLPPLFIVFSAVAVCLYSQPDRKKEPVSASLSRGEGDVTPRYPVKDLPPVNGRNIEAQIGPAPKNPARSSARGPSHGDDKKKQVAERGAANPTPPVKKGRGKSETKAFDHKTVEPEPFREVTASPAVALFYNVHAISWSKDPSHRLAVINSSVVHEGERVDGGMVVRIDKDGVVIRKEGLDHKVRLGTRQ